MSKVFRLHEEGQDGTGWFNSQPVTGNDLDSIITDGKKVSNSIPSPFARMDLVKSSFEWVAEHAEKGKNDINGQTVHHQLVSEALDLGQLLFYAEKYEDEITIKEYNPAERFNQEFSNNDSRHQRLARALDVYWQQDEEVYNYGDAEQLFLVYYNEELIGSTSPASLYMSAPITKTLRDKINLNRQGRKYFSEEAVSLARRKWDFVKYLFALNKQSDFSRLFPEFSNYLREIKKLLPNKKQKRINGLKESELADYDRCHVSGSPGNSCEVAGVPLHLAPSNVKSIEEDSDFTIDSYYPIDSLQPLILPNSIFNKNWVYTSADVKWKSQKYKDQIPSKNTKELNDSTLPIEGDKYPWLSVDNFLTDKIIELPYDIDDGSFVVASNQQAPKNYLLPLTETFFKYFQPQRVDDLLSIEEMKRGTVMVELDIPVSRDEKITYKKNYKKADKIDAELHLAIMPFVKVEQANVPVKYNVGIIDGDFENNDSNDIILTCYRQGETVKIGEPVVRGPGKSRLKTFYSSTKKYFDAIKITFNGQEAFILPDMPEYQPGAESAHFAVDLGTTNTHIEFKIDNNKEQTFDNISAKPFWNSLLDQDSDADRSIFLNEEAYENEFIPFTVGEDESLTSFPLRTAVVENSSINLQDEVEIFKHINNYLLYDKRMPSKYLKAHSNLKWQDINSKEHRVRLRSYIKNLALFIFYKILTSNISLSGVSVTWFYPVSMRKNHRGLMDTAWRDSTELVLGKSFNQQNLNRIPESVGPYYYYYKKRSLTGLTVSIDIGGESSDISIYDEGKPKFISSFRFAGDAIFGDGYGKGPNRNGFVNAFRSDAESFLGENDTILDMLSQSLNKKEESRDFSSYLFSVSKETRGTFDYSSLIRNSSNIKFVIFLFHAAIAYYIAKVMNGEDQNFPETILYSGTAAKTINLIDTSPSLENIEDLFKFILEKVNSKKMSQSINCELSDIPKKITSKGGLISNDVSTDDYKIIDWIGGQGKFDKNIDKNNYKSRPKYEDLSSSNYELIIDSVKNFFFIVDEYVGSRDIEDLFGIDRKAYNRFKEIRNDKLEGYLKRGIKQAIQEHDNNDDSAIEETLFFYPLTGLMSKLAFQLSKLDENSN